MEKNLEHRRSNVQRNKHNLRPRSQETDTLNIIYNVGLLNIRHYKHNLQRRQLKTRRYRMF